MSFLLPALFGLGGAALGAFGKDKKKESFQQLPTLTPQQQSVLSQLLGNVQNALPPAFSYLQNLLQDNPESYNDYEAPYMRQFNEQIVPGIAERFSGLGAGSQRSSAFQQALGQAGAGLSESLAGQRANLRQNSISQLQGFLGSGLRSPFETAYMPAQQSGLQRFGNALAPLSGLGIGGLLSGFSR